MHSDIVPTPLEPIPNKDQMYGRLYIRHTHVHGYRSGQWARIIGLSSKFNKGRNPLICYHVEFVDGKRDWWRVYDSDEPYEFSYDITA